MQKYDKIYINGKWIAPQGAEKALEVFDSTNEEVMASIPSCNAKDVDAAAQAARAAFIGWAALDVQERAKYMNRIGYGIAARMDELATAISRETGMTKFLSQMIQVGLPINSFKQAAIVAEKFEYQHELGNSLVVREPIGVVGCITPWNYPLHQIVAKVALQWQQVARSFSSQARSLRSTRLFLLRSLTKSVCLLACSTLSLAPAQLSAKQWPHTKKST